MAVFESRGSLLEVVLSPGDVYPWPETFLVLTAGEMMLAPGGGRPGMLLNILWYPGRQPSSYPAQVSTLPRLRSPILIC